jgi:hypothetical protein
VAHRTVLRYHNLEVASLWTGEKSVQWGMSNVLKVSLQTTIYSLAESGWSQRLIASELGINRETGAQGIRVASIQYNTTYNTSTSTSLVFYCFVFVFVFVKTRPPFPTLMSDFYDLAHNAGNAPEALAHVQRNWFLTLRAEKGLALAVNLAGPFIMSSQGKP